MHRLVQPLRNVLRTAGAAGLLAVALVLAPEQAAAQTPPLGFINQSVDYAGCDQNISVVRSCTNLRLRYTFWDTNSGWVGGPEAVGATQFFIPGTVDCLRSFDPGPEPGCGFIPRFNVGTLSFNLGGCSDVCRFDGTPDPNALAPSQITIAVAYGPAGELFLFGNQSPQPQPGVALSSYVLTRTSTTVPEPTTIALVASGLVGLATVARRRRA